MITFDEPKDPDVSKTYRFNWAKRVGSTTIASVGPATVVSGGVTVVSTVASDTFVDVKVSGGTHGTPAVIQVNVTYANGDTDEEAGIISVLSSGYQKTELETAQESLAALKAARQSRLVNGAVKQVRRGDRVLIYDNASAEEIDRAIDRIEQEIENLTNAAAGRPRRSAITPVWTD